MQTENVQRMHFSEKAPGVLMRCFDSYLVGHRRAVLVYHPGVTGSNLASTTGCFFLKLCGHGPSRVHALHGV